MSGPGSSGAILQAALVEHLAGVLSVSVFDAPPVRAGDPHAVVDEPVLADWSTKTWTGREGRVAVQLIDAGERPVRLRALAATMEEALEDWRPQLAGGWRLVALRLARSRLVRAGERWRGVSEFTVRMWREDG